MTMRNVQHCHHHHHQQQQQNNHRRYERKGRCNDAVSLILLLLLLLSSSMTIVSSSRLVRGDFRKRSGGNNRNNESIIKNNQKNRGGGNIEATKKLAPTPPMGWMNWEIFRCNINCAQDPKNCVNDDLFRSQTDALVKYGYLDAGYDTIHIDDCWMNKDGRKNPAGKGKSTVLEADAERFPHGMKDLGDYMHSLNVKFGLYTAENTRTCAGYPASAGYEDVDAKTFASWGVDYLKVDGCGNKTYYPRGYEAMGKALKGSGRDIVYSCSWPAYLGGNESTKTQCYEDMIDMGCNLWRNYGDIGCDWGSLSNIIEHWGEYGSIMAQYAAPGHFNDPDMLLIGNGDCITISEARSQMTIWSIVAAPLIMGNDLRVVPKDHRAVLLNAEAIRVNQDVLGKQGVRISGNANSGQVWSRELHDGSRALGLYNPTNANVNITIRIADLGMDDGNEAWMNTADTKGATLVVTVRDIWSKTNLGEMKFTESISRIVPPHDTAFFKVSKKSSGGKKEEVEIERTVTGTDTVSTNEVFAMK